MLKKSHFTRIAIVSTCLLCALSIGVTAFASVQAESDNLNDVFTIVYPDASMTTQSRGNATPNSLESLLDGKELLLYPQYAAEKSRLLPAAENKFESAIAWHTNYIMENGLEYNCDIDDAKFQEYVKAFLPEESAGDIYEELLEFQRFIDYYENTAKNERITEISLQLANSKELVMDESDAEKTKDMNSTTALVDELMLLLPMNQRGTATQFAERTATVEPMAYSGSSTATYARNWAYKTNNTSYPYYASYNGASTTNNYMGSNVGKVVDGQTLVSRPWNDCTNFVSQCLKAGGLESMGNILTYTSYKSWYYSDTKPSHTWGGANNLCDHLYWRIGTCAAWTSDLQVGDCAFFDSGGDGDADHGAIISRIANGKEYLCQHTSDKKESNTFNASYTTDPCYLGKWFENGYTVWAFEIDKA